MSQAVNSSDWNQLGKTEITNGNLKGLLFGNAEFTCFVLFCFSSLV